MQEDSVEDLAQEMPQEMSEQWLDEKLVKFAGVNEGMDTVGVRGQLLEDE